MTLDVRTPVFAAHVVPIQGIAISMATPQPALKIITTHVGISQAASVQAVLVTDVPGYQKLEADPLIDGPSIQE